jgi:hypothetical protein
VVKMLTTLGAAFLTTGAKLAVSLASRAGGESSIWSWAADFGDDSAAGAGLSRHALTATRARERDIRNVASRARRCDGEFMIEFLGSNDSSATPAITSRGDALHFMHDYTRCHTS